jgi:CubicO group peptidase (beta-lactamase class C family)
MKNVLPKHGAALLLSVVLLIGAGSWNICVAQEAGADQVAQVNQLFESWDDPNSAGCAVGVIKDGEFIHRRGYGMANLEHDIPLSSESVFYIASTSKQFVAASIILAAEQGHLALEDDIRDWVPELPDYGHTITVRNLLNHTSGVRDYLTLWSLADEKFEDVHTEDDALGMIVRQKNLNFEPGEEYLYSNSGYFLLSVIIERATGKSLKEYSLEYIFEPLGMENSHFHDDHTHISKNRAIGHFARNDGSMGVFVSNFDQVGSGGLHTSVDDLLLWDQNFYDNQLGEGTLLAELHRQGVLNDGTEIDYASGLVVDEYNGLKTVSHGGGAQNYRTEMLRFPDQQFTVICLCNLGSINPSQLSRSVADIYLADQFVQAEEALVEDEAAPREIAFVELSTSELEAWNGAYQNPTTGTIWEVSADDRSELKSVVNGGFTFFLGGVSSTEFKAVRAPFQLDARFENQGPGQPRLVHVDFEDGTSATYHEVELAEPTPEELEEYAGTYYSEELDYTQELVIHEGALNTPDDLETPLTPTLKDEFRAGGVTLKFTRNENGQLSGFVLNAGRVRGLEYTKTE